MIPNDLESFGRDFSDLCFESNDALFAGSNVKQGLIDFNLIRQYWNYIGDAATFWAVAKSIKTFVDFLASKKNGPKQVEGPGRSAKSGNLRIWSGGAPNVAVIEGEGTPPPIIEICETRPLFHIQRGFLLVLRNVRIEYRGSGKGIFLEASGPSFFPDPENVSIVQVDECCNNPGNFLVKKPIWIGAANGNPYE